MELRLQRVWYRSPCFEGARDFYQDNYDVQLTNVLEFLCESAAPVQSHLQAQIFPSDQSRERPILYSDLTTLADFGHGIDIIDGIKKNMPTTSQGFTCGFSCTSRSPKNPRARENINCIQMVVGLTSPHVLLFSAWFMWLALPAAGVVYQTSHRVSSDDSSLANDWQ